MKPLIHPELSGLFFLLSSLLSHCDVVSSTVSSLWRDVKVVNDHAYIVSEASGHGLQVSRGRGRGRSRSNGKGKGWAGLGQEQG